MIVDRPFVQGSATSAAAAASIPKASAIDARAKVFAYIHSRGIDGATRQEIQDALDMAGDTVRPRVAELLSRDLIAPSGEIRRSATGRACEVLCAKEFAA